MTTDRPGLSGIAKQAIARMRSDLARLDLCGHGVQRQHCREKHETTTTTEESA